MQKEKSIGRNILIVVLILVTIASVCAGLFAWAKYQTTINGTATGETAKWSFKVSDGDTSTQEIDFQITRTDNNTSVATGKLAPGTYGELEIGIDATGTETSLTYVIEGTMENRPTNMKFYSDAERTLELIVLDGKFTKGGYMQLNEVGARTETIYWEWPFETITKPIITDEKLADLGVNKTEFNALINEQKFTEANDMLDTAESSIQVSMIVSVTGKQLNENFVLADLVQVGDYVNYNAASGDGVNKSYSTDNSTGSSVVNTFSSTDVFNSQAKAQWRVFSVDKELGVIELISVEPTPQTVTLNGTKGFANTEIILNSIGEVYGHGNGAKEARSLKLDDIQRYSSYNPYNDKDENKTSNLLDYGGTISYTSGKLFEETKDAEGDIIGYSASVIEASSTSPITITNNSFTYTANKYINNSTIYNMIFKKNGLDEDKEQFWLASRATTAVEGRTWCDFVVRKCLGGRVIGDGLYHSDSYGSSYSQARAVTVLVSLEDNIKTVGQDADGVWQLDVE